MHIVFSFYFCRRWTAGSIYFKKDEEVKRNVAMERVEEREGCETEEEKRKKRNLGYYFCSLSVNWNHKIPDRFREGPTESLPDSSSISGPVSLCNVAG